jgi:predicted SAM-dependent methyltransferase
MNSSGDIRVQYGCGFVAPEDWVNFDSSLTLWYERTPVLGLLHNRNGNRFPRNVRFGNIAKGLPIPDRACSGVYASHVLEHLTRREFDSALANTYRMLRGGGLFRMVVPDLEAMAREYLRLLEEGSSDASAQFLTWTSFCIGERSFNPARVVRNLLTRRFHHWMYDYAALSAALRRHGFVAVRRCHFNDCEDPAFASVERVERFTDALAVECRRPRP